MTQATKTSNEVVSIKQLVQKLFLQSLYPALSITGGVILYFIGLRVSSHLYTPEINAEIASSLTRTLQILITTCLCWLSIRLISQLNYYLYIYYNDHGYNIAKLSVSFIASSLKTILILSFTTVIIDMLPISQDFIYLTQKIVSILIICTIAWILIKLINLIEQVLFYRYGINVNENLFTQKIHTQITLLKRIIISVLCILAIGTILMQFNNVRELGTTILASAGIATIIVGLGIQKLLNVLIIGLQIALNHPIKINDYVIIEAEFGQIEEITLNYVVLRIWDLRKLIIPINCILEKPFQNLSHGSTNLLGTVFLYVDFSIPIDKIQHELTKIIKNSSFSDQALAQLQVSDYKESALELRALVSAKNPSNLWNLRCEVREKLVKFIHKNYPRCLPRTRYEHMSESAESKEVVDPHRDQEKQFYQNSYKVR